jgi:flagellar hook-associated protein 3 FlgL
MTLSSSVSLLGTTNAQINRLTGMRKTMDDLERQVGTQKKYDTLTGFGLSAQTILQLHADRDQIQTYSDNIDAAVSNMKTMSDDMSKVSDALSKMVSLLQNQPRDAQFDSALINSQAQQTLDFLADVMNQNLTGRYLFAGTDSQNAPIADIPTLTANFAAEMTNWMSGATTTNQIISNTDAFSGTALGLSASVSSAQPLTVRIDSAVEISYGAIADRSGIQDALRALGFMANLRAPNPASDVPTNGEFSTVIDHILDVARNAKTAMEATQGAMTGNLTLAQNIQATHKQDLNILSEQVEKMENADITQIITQLQALQTQLTASYEATRLASQLSLANFIT